MLNELKVMSDKVNEMIDDVDYMYPYVINAPAGTQKNAYIKVLLGKNGAVKRVEKIEKNVWLGDTDKGLSGFYYVYKGASDSYPIFKLSIEKLFSLSKKDHNKFLKYDKIPSIPKDNLMTKKGAISKNIFKHFDIEQELINGLERNSQTEGIFLLAERFACFECFEDYNKLLRDIISKSLDLFNEESKNKKEIVKKDLLKEFYVCFDIYEGVSNNVPPITHISTMNEISELYKALSVIDESDGLKLDLFGNKFNESLAHKFPQMNFGGTRFYIYSRNQYSSCYETYGVNAQNCCEISGASRNHIVKHIAYLLKNEHKNVYWDMYKNDNFTDGFIGFAPLDKNLLEEFNELCIRGIHINEEEEIAKKSASLFDNIRGSKAYRNDDNAYMLLIRIPGNGPSKIVMSEIVKVRNLFNFAKKWELGWKNYAGGNKFNLSLPIKKGESKNLYSFVSLYDMMKILNKKWNRKAEASAAKGISNYIYMNDMFKLFMGDKYILNRITKILSNNHIYLLIDLVNRMHNYSQLKSHNKPLNLFGVRKDVFKLPVVLGQIVFYQGMISDQYKETLPYCLGKITSLASKIQKEYLEFTNSKSMPTNMIGTKHIYNMLVNPALAMKSIFTESQYFLTQVNIIRKTDYLLNKENKRFYSYFEFLKTLNKIKEFDLNTKMKDLDCLLIAMGYFQNR